MRMSRVLLAGAAVAAAGIATSAFTNSNTVNESVAGYNEAEVSGVVARHIDYVIDPNDASKLTSIDFQIVEDLTAPKLEGLAALLTLNNVSGTAIGPATSCDIGTWVEDTPDGDYTPISCNIAGTDITSFQGIGLTVAE
jgi:hypothetical protein